ncbi:MAG: hypothetical protein HDT38_00035 [Clostridiales bacterium]|nr:hypothetical protein [Clostridiales bacterium]
MNHMKTTAKKALLGEDIIYEKADTKIRMVSLARVRQLIEEFQMHRYFL